MEIRTDRTIFRLDKNDPDSVWDLRTSWKETEKDLFFLEFSLDAAEDLPPPELTLSWDLPLLDTVNCWTTCHGGGSELQPDWGRKHHFSIADEIPELVFHNREGICTVAAAYSDAMRVTEFSGGIHESDCSLRFTLKVFTRKEMPLRHYRGILRLDLRRMFFADTVRAISAWFATLPGYGNTPVPESAFDPLYSTWYSYHHDVHDRTVLQECREAAKYGMKTLIVDSGWDNDDNTLGPIACGDWEPSKKRFPDFASHVREIQNLGFRYLLWFAVPFIGKHSSRYAHFQGKYLFELPDAGVLDPRFPDVRKFLIDSCSRLMREYGIDGLKLDFINTFTECTDDPALTRGMGERDIPVITDAVDRLMTDLSSAIRAVRPDALIEFRQCYIGPAIRKYGNLLRAADCPADPGGNRRRTLNLRLTSGCTAVHSDMLEWRSDYDVRHAALQLLNIMFSVPQISVRLAELPSDHRQMLEFLLGFFVRHRALLVKSDLHPCAPDQNYPLVYAEAEGERIAVLYCGGITAELGFSPTIRSLYLVNATEREYVFADLTLLPGTAALLRDCRGEVLPFEPPQTGLSRLRMPPGSILRLRALEISESRKGALP